MGKLKPRLKGKGKRWPKGQSSSSNPKNSKYRDAAKTRFFTPNLGTTNALTVGALKTHDAFTLSQKPPPQSVPSDDGSNYSEWAETTSNASSASFKTFASVYSNCSNVSFSKLLQNFQPNSDLHKEMLAVLAAVTEIIQSTGGTESSTEYFGALMTALDASETEASTAAILSLLGMGIKTVPQEVLRLKFEDASKTVMDTFSKYSEGDNFVIIRNAIGILSVLIRNQDAAVLASSSTSQIYQSILVFSTFSKAKVRKAAQYAVCAILKGSIEIKEYNTHPLAAQTAKFCVAKIEENTTLGGGTSTLHVLALLKEILCTFPKAQIKTTCEVILKLLTLGKVMMTKCCFQALHGLFISAPLVSRLTPTLNAKLINALYDYQPAPMDWESVMAWLSVMQEAYCNLARIDPELCAANLLKLFNVVFQLLLTDNTQVLINATVVLRTALFDCLSKCNDCEHFFTISKNIFGVIEGGLKYQYHKAWPHILNLLAVIFEVLGNDAELFCGPCLKSLAELRDSYNFAYTSELEFTIGRAIRSLGPEVVLKYIPLEITGREVNYEFKRAWLIPLLKENIQTSTLEYFTRNILPMASICRKRSEELEKAKDVVGSHSYDLLCCQLWALLPSFCNNPTDVAKNFKQLAQTLGVILSDRKSLRMSIMSALRKLILKSQENKSNEDIDVLRRFAKNYLPILFNVYTTKPVGTDDEGQRLACFTTIEAYLSITSKALCEEFFDKAHGHLSDSNTDSFMKESVLDLIKALLPYLDSQRVEKVYNTTLQLLKSAKNNQEEKKAYRLLEHLCSSETDICKEFVTSKLADIQKMLLKSLMHKKPTNAGARLRCLRHLIRLIPKSQFHIITTIVPEVILRCKDQNAKTRACAFDLLTEMLMVSKEWSDKSNEDLIRDYFKMIQGGLAGSSTLAAATLLGLAKLAYRLRDELPSDILEMLLENVSILLGMPVREVTTACLSFIKTIISSYRRDIMLPHIPLIVRSIVSMTDDCKRHSRLKVRDILDRLLRKYDYDTIKYLIPEYDTKMQKRLKNLKKIHSRKKKLKESSLATEEDEEMEFSVKNKPKSIEEILASSDESDIDDNDDDDQPRKPIKKKKQRQMYIREEEDDIVDLISPAAASKLSASKPLAEVATKEKTKEAKFKTTADGRLIITKDLDDGPSERKKLNSISDLDDSDEEFDDVASAMSKVEIGKKRKMSSVASRSVTSEPAFKYQAGGSGIHRPIKKKQNIQDDDGIKTGKEYRAKKAKGDIKIKGKPDPYAYIPLSRKMLSKRKKAKMSSKFKNVMKSAVKGAKMGAKYKGKKK